MRIDYVNNAIMEVLLAGDVTIKGTVLDNIGHIFSDTGIVAYVLQEDEIFFNVHKCVRSDALETSLTEKAPATRPEYLLKKTLDARVGKGGALFTRLKASDWDTFVDMDLLEAFDRPNFYQAEKNRHYYGYRGNRRNPAGSYPRLCHACPYRSGNRRPLQR